MGIDTSRIFAIAMGLAFVVSRSRRSISALRANFDPTIGPARLIYAFEAVIIGGLGSLWGTLAGGIVLGVAQTVGARINPEWQILAGHLAFLVGAGAAAARPVPARHGLKRDADDATSTQPKRFRIETADAASRASPPRGAGAAARPGAAAGLRRPRADAGSDLRLLHAGARAVLEPARGYAGLVSVGQQAFVGLRRLPAVRADAASPGFDPLLAIPLAASSAALLGAADRARRVPPARRLFRHRHLGGGGGLSAGPRAGEGARRRHRHLAAARRSPTSVLGIEWIKALFDVRTPAARDIVSYWLALALLAGTLALVYLLLRSRRGLALAAIRDNEAAAAASASTSTAPSSSSMSSTAAGTGMIGALIYLQKARISPDAAFSVLDWTAYVIFIVVIGGIGTIEGPIVGAIVFYLLQHYLADFGTWYLILLGALAIVVMLFAPQGLWGLVAERYDLTLFPMRRRLSIRDRGNG